MKTVRTPKTPVGTTSPAGGIVAQSCYDEAMKKRPGGTTHLSISLPTEQAKILRRRARQAYGGNVSRVVSDAIRYIAYELPERLQRND